MAGDQNLKGDDESPFVGQHHDHWPPIIISVTPLENFRLRVNFITGQAGIFDLKPLIAEGRVYSPLADQSTFNTVRVSPFDGTFINWAGNITLESEVIYEEIFKSNQ